MEPEQAYLFLPFIHILSQIIPIHSFALYFQIKLILSPIYVNVFQAGFFLLIFLPNPVHAIIFFSIRATYPTRTNVHITRFIYQIWDEVKITVSWDIKHCRLVDIYRRFAWKNSHYCHGITVTLLFFHPGDRRSMFLWVRWNSTTLKDLTSRKIVLSAAGSSTNSSGVRIYEREEQVMKNDLYRRYLSPSGVVCQLTHKYNENTVQQNMLF
jgi:hypothetical protein